MNIQREYYQPLAAAYIRGKLPREVYKEYPGLFTSKLDELNDTELEQLVGLAEAHALRIHRFKRSMQLPRVQKVLGILKSLQPANLLDIGTGRGVFLWPLLDALPDLSVTCVDSLDYRAADLLAMHQGGLTRLEAMHGDATALPFASRSFDIVTMLEVLEHIPETHKALSEVCRVAQRCIIFSVPSKADNNPEHIHLFTQDRLRLLLAEHTIKHVHFEYVLNHMIVIARIEQI